MKERPIIFSGPMVRAILEGRKTQTRRASGLYRYHVGQRLWVKEAWMPRLGNTGAFYRAELSEISAVGLGNLYKRWKSPLSMPRWASRITLEVTGVRIERLQDISDADAKAEGIEGYVPGFRVPAFSNLWDTMNSKRGMGWDSNPWVCVIEFKKI